MMSLVYLTFDFLFLTFCELFIVQKFIVFINNLPASFWVIWWILDASKWIRTFAGLHWIANITATVTPGTWKLRKSKSIKFHYKQHRSTKIMSTKFYLINLADPCDFRCFVIGNEARVFLPCLNFCQSQLGNKYNLFQLKFTLKKRK